MGQYLYPIMSHYHLIREIIMHNKRKGYASPYIICKTLAAQSAIWGFKKCYLKMVCNVAKIFHQLHTYLQIKYTTFEKIVVSLFALFLCFSFRTKYLSYVSRIQGSDFNLKDFNLNYLKSRENKLKFVPLFPPKNSKRFESHCFSILYQSQQAYQNEQCKFDALCICRRHLEAYMSMRRANFTLLINIFPSILN